MRVIERKWTELAAGYLAIQAFQVRLETEFNRAVDVGYQQQYQRDLTAWQKKRRVFLSFVIIAPLSIVGLCLSAFYFREVACVIIYWVVLVLIILVTLGVAVRSYIGEAMNRPVRGSSKPPSMDLEGRWWQGLAPQELAITSGDKKMKPDFVASLAGLPDTFLARGGLPVEGEASLYVFAPSGPWIFTLRDWKGNIIRQDEIWKDAPRRGEPVDYTQAPDAQWVQLKDALVHILNERFPQMGGKIQGGVVFVDPHVHLFKDQIQGNTAAFGMASAWVSRLGQAAPADGLTTGMQLETLDALIARETTPGQPLDLTWSAKELAVRLYQESVADLRAFVGKMVG
jgi:hypothetical protein